MSRPRVRKAVVRLLTELFRWNNWRTFEDLTLHMGNRPLLQLSWNQHPDIRVSRRLATETEIRLALRAARCGEEEGHECLGARYAAHTNKEQPK